METLMPTLIAKFDGFPAGGATLEVPAASLPGWADDAQHLVRVWGEAYAYSWLKPHAVA